MKAFALVISVLVVGGYIFASEDAPKRFKTLAEAAEALDAALASTDATAALNALIRRPQSYLASHPEVVRMTLEAHKQTGAFAQFYAKRSFPTEVDNFTLGGHNSELGHVNIDFIRTADGTWVLEDIWNCR